MNRTYLRSKIPVIKDIRLSPSNILSPHNTILAAVGKGKNVLDVGCGPGHLSKAMRDQGNNVDGIEIDDDAIAIAKDRCNNVWKVNVERDPLPVPEENYDVLVFADVLEHMVWPDDALANLTKYLKKDGIIIVAIPNAAEFRIRLRLLVGKFQYDDSDVSGLMDVTHVRWFTRSTAKELINAAGFRILKIYSVGLSYYYPFKILPTWFAEEFVFIAQRM